MAGRRAIAALCLLAAGCGAPPSAARMGGPAAAAWEPAPLPTQRGETGPWMVFPDRPRNAPGRYQPQGRRVLYDTFNTAPLPAYSPFILGSELPRRPDAPSP